MIASENSSEDISLNNSQASHLRALTERIGGRRRARRFTSLDVKATLVGIALVITNPHNAHAQGVGSASAEHIFDANTCPPPSGGGLDGQAGAAFDIPNATMTCGHCGQNIVGSELYMDFDVWQISPSSGANQITYAIQELHYGSDDAIHIIGWYKNARMWDPGDLKKASVFVFYSEGEAPSVRIFPGGERRHTVSTTVV